MHALNSWPTLRRERGGDCHSHPCHPHLLITLSLQVKEHQLMGWQMFLKGSYRPTGEIIQWSKVNFLVKYRHCSLGASLVAQMVKNLPVMWES